MKRKTQKRNKRDWPETCKGCGAAITECDYLAERCTNCNQSLGSTLPENEHVHVLGLPAVVVTRAFYYDWLKKQGADLRPTGKINSYDWVVWGSPATDAPLTDKAERDRLLRWMAQAMKREAA